MYRKFFLSHISSKLCFYIMTWETIKKYISYSWNNVCHLQCLGIYCNFLVVYKISKTTQLTQGGVKVVFLKNLFWKNTFSKYHLLFIHENITQQHLFFEDFSKLAYDKSSIVIKQNTVFYIYSWLEFCIDIWRKQASYVCVCVGGCVLVPVC